MTSRDGFVWTPKEGGSYGIPSISVIHPQQHGVQDAPEKFDVIVIGAGYCGLVAARDLATQGMGQAPMVDCQSHHVNQE